MLIDYNKQIKTITSIRRGELKQGLKLDIPEIDEYFRLKPQDFGIWLGHANVGKTSLTIYLMVLYSMRHNSKWLIYSSENEPYELIQKILEFIIEEPLNRIIPADFNKGMEFIREHFHFIDNNKLYTYKELLEEAQNHRIAFKYDGFLIDPYNSLAKDKEMLKGLGMHEYDYEATTDIRLFCKKNKVTVWLCTHANTEAIRQVYRDGQYAGYPKVPESSSIEGGGKFVNRCDFFAVAHRFIQHPTEFMYSQMHIKKVKSISSGGRCTPLDSPILLKAITNNVGYSINNESLVKRMKLIKAPF
jgi:hypothetical protein